LFFAGVLVLIALCSPSRTAADHLPGYVFFASTIGLAMVLYLAYASYFILNVVCLLCVGTYIAVIGLFLISGAATKIPLTSLPMRIIDDLKLLVRTPRALAAAVVFIAVATTALIAFPEQHVAAAESVAEGEQAPATPAPTAAQIKQLEDWLSKQPRVPVVAPSDGAAVVILKFNDYQCPGCGQTYRDYKPIFAKWAKQAPGKVKFISKDYPLERQCNQFVGQDLHPGACEAAVAVRLAREKGKAEAMEDWLFANQPAMNPETVKKAAATVGGVTDFDARFAATLELVRADVAQGAQLKVGSTPTFFMNGMQLPGLRGEFFDAAIAWELRRVSGGK
jgi:protein-disulfide isomerase